MFEKLAFLFAVLSLYLFTPNAAHSQVDYCSICLKDPIPYTIPACSPTPTPCVSPSISLSRNSVALQASIGVYGNAVDRRMVTDGSGTSLVQGQNSYPGYYQVAAYDIITIIAPAGSQLRIIGDSSANIVGNKIHFSETGAVNYSQTTVADYGFSGDPWSGHFHNWTTSHLYSVAFTKSYTVEASNVCGTSSASFSISASGQAHFYTNDQNWNASPISLNLTGKKLDLSSRRFPKVQFKLSAKTDIKVYWLASADTPLLVWDPHYSGEIKDGRQLFGTWSFGKTWKNGYEALASLDRDKNSVLRGDELSGIRMWADGNRNGISEKGEVLDLELFGISELKVRYNRSEHLPIHGIDLYISDKGFKYIRNGMPMFAETFDWFVPDRDEEGVFLSELKHAQNAGYIVKEWVENDFNHMGNRSYGYLMVRKDINNKLTGFHIRALKSRSEQPEYSLYSRPVFGTWSDTRFDFVFRDEQMDGLSSETINAFARIENDRIIPERLEIIQKQQGTKEYKREVGWKLMEPARPF